MEELHARRGELSRAIMQADKDLRDDAELHTITLSTLSLVAAVCVIITFAATVAAGPVLFIMALTVAAIVATDCAYRRGRKGANAELRTLRAEADRLDVELNRGDMYDSSRPSLFARSITR